MEVKQSMNDSDLEFIKQELMRIGVKLDAMPQMYVPRPEYDGWRMATDKRLDQIESDNKSGRAWEVEEHTRLAQQMAESERRIIERIDKKDDAQGAEIKDAKKDAQAFKVMLLLVLFSAVAAPTLFLVVNYLLSHR